MDTKICIRKTKKFICRDLYFCQWIGFGSLFQKVPMLTTLESMTDPGDHIQVTAWVMSAWDSFKTRCRVVCMAIMLKKKRWLNSLRTCLTTMQHCYMNASNPTQMWTVLLEGVMRFEIVTKWADRQHWPSSNPQSKILPPIFKIWSEKRILRLRSLRYFSWTWWLSAVDGGNISLLASTWNSSNFQDPIERGMCKRSTACINGVVRFTHGWTRGLPCMRGTFLLFHMCACFFFFFTCVYFFLFLSLQHPPFLYTPGDTDTHIY